MLSLLFILPYFIKSKSGIPVGNISSLNRLDIYLDPASAKTSEFYVQFQQTIVDYKNYANINIHPLPSSQNNYSFTITTFMYAIGSLNLTIEQNIDILFYILYTNPIPLLDIKQTKSEEELISQYSQLIEQKFNVKSPLILNAFKEEQLKQTVDENCNNFSNIELPAILFNDVMVPFYGFKSFIYYNIKDLQKVTKRKSFRSFRKNKDKKGIQRYSEIYFGYLYSKYVLDFYFDPVNKSTKKILSQIVQILQNYSSSLKIVAHIVPTPENKKSFMMTSLINAVKKINPHTVTKFLPWIVENRQELFYNDNNSTENEILDNILPILDSNFGLNHTLVLKKYFSVENEADSIGAIFNLVFEKIKSLPYAKINGYSFALDDDTDLIQLFKEHLVLKDKSFNYQNGDDL